MKIIKKYLSNKRILIFLLYFILVLFVIIYSITFSIFDNKTENNFANIKVAGMNYGMTINGIPGSKITVPSNNTTIINVSINSLNSIDSKYELVYKICSSSKCETYIEKPSDLVIEYSSRTPDLISGSIVGAGTKNMRIALINNGSNTYYIEFNINAGYTHNTLALQNLITNEYNEEDVTIAAIVDGVISTTFPTTNNYITSVECKTNGGVSNAIGTIMWNGSKWILNITGVDTGRTICNVFFDLSLRDKILAQWGGAASIIAKGTPNFNYTIFSSEMFASEDEYGTSYFYRGLKTELSNNLIWGGFQWKIIRINGDASVRLIYNGTESQFITNGTFNAVGINTQITTTTWNITNMNDAKYVGYMYGGGNGVASTVRNGMTSEAATYNETSTNIKNVLDSWYKNNILGKSFASQVVDNLFCNDRQLQSEVGGQATGPGFGDHEIGTYFATYHRVNIKNYTLKCGFKNDRFTVDNTTLGNGELNYPVGLMTADEVIMSGLTFGRDDSSLYLYSNQEFWLLSPFYMVKNSGAYVWNVSAEGSASASYVSKVIGVRPVISINGNIIVSGTGTLTDPYKVI